MNNKRLQALLGFIKESDKVVDVGCDHAYLSKMLAKRGQASIACDIVSSIIEERKREDKNDLITYLISDGLKQIPSDAYNLPVLSGMGTFSILDIIKKSSISFDRVLTASNSKYKNLREGMKELGFVSIEEQVVKENNKFYNIIMFEKGNGNYTEKELYIGKNHKDKKTLDEKNKYLKNKYSKILKNLPEDSEILKELKYL